MKESKTPLLTDDTKHKTYYFTMKMFVVVAFLLTFAWFLTQKQGFETELEEIPVGGEWKLGDWNAPKCKVYNLGIEDKNQICKGPKGKTIDKKFVCDVSRSAKTRKRNNLINYVA